MSMKSFLIAAVLVSLSSTYVFAARSELETIEEKISAFREVSDVPAEAIKVPTVVDAPVEYLPVVRQQMAVFDQETQQFVPSSFVHKYHQIVRIFSDQSPEQDFALNDHDYTTYVDFEVPENSVGQAILTVVADKPFTADSLWLGLAKHVRMPQAVEIRAMVNGVDKIIIAEMDTKGVCVRCLVFPETTAAKWQVKFSYGQLLRISEIAFNQMKKADQVTTYLRFLMQPEHSYQIFRVPDRAVTIPVGEAGDLHDDKEVMRLQVTRFMPNPIFYESDIDDDGVPDIRDNCVSVANVDQADINNNFRGDFCDDYDRDGLINSKDNCPNHPNRGQKDIDGDGIGDVCDKEESRLTEKNPWLSWLVLSCVGILMLFFFIRVSKGMPPKDS